LAAVSYSAFASVARSLAVIRERQKWRLLAGNNFVAKIAA
jgi:hypothetical protein